MRDLSRSLNIECLICGEKSKLGEWNDMTWEYCVNREMKRKFTPLVKVEAFRKNSGKYYKCPKCGRWSRGSQLKITDTNDRFLLSLGGEGKFLKDDQPEFDGYDS